MTGRRVRLRDRVFAAVATAWFGTSTPELLSPGQRAGANILTDRVIDLFQAARPQAPAPRPFELFRTEDPSGVSGTGVVALGVEWPDGSVAVRWPGEHASTAVWGSIDAVLKIHGHGGLTVVRWLDDPNPVEVPR